MTNNFKNVTIDLNTIGDKVTTLHAGINLGNMYVKVVGDSDKDIFMSSVKKIEERELRILGASNDKVIKINGEFFLVGESSITAGEIQTRPLKALHVLTVYSLARQAQKDTKKFLTRSGKFRYNLIECNIALGLSLEEFLAKDERTGKYLDEILKDNFHGKSFEVEYKGCKSFYKLNVVSVQAEGYSHYEMNGADYIEKYGEDATLFFLDAGSLSWDMVRVVDGQPRDPKGIRNAGTIKLIQSIANVINDAYVTTEHIEKMLFNGYVKVGKNKYERDDYKNIIDTYAKETIDIMKNKYTDVSIASHNKIIAFGGGAYLIEDVLREEFENSTDVDILPNSVYVNAEAYYTASFLDCEE